MPAAFYRHFESMEALGLVLIDESFRTLRDMLRGARAGKLDPSRVIESTVDILIAGVNERREHWRFIGRERNSGVTVLRYAIRTEIRLITSELAIDLARFPGLNTWSTEDLNILARLFVNSMISIAEAIEDAGDPDGTRGDQADRRQAAAADRRRRRRLAQQRLRGAAKVCTGTRTAQHAARAAGAGPRPAAARPAAPAGRARARVRYRMLRQHGYDDAVGLLRRDSVWLPCRISK